MRLLCFLFFSLALVSAPVPAAEYYSVAGEVLFSKPSDKLDFDFGRKFAVQFNAHTEWFYYGGSIGFSVHEYDFPNSHQALSQHPIIFRLGTAHAFQSGGEDYERLSYFLGLSIGVNQGLLLHESQADPSAAIIRRTYKDLAYEFGLEGGVLFGLTDNLFLGPKVGFESTRFTFKDKSFSQGTFARDYSGGGFSLGVTAYLLMGNF